ncbi:carbohydrate esterase family 8 protein [Hymenopellis radicata]|nr:carbohydrate esterase family 8 protein [Hymenopellis radicata]
MSFIKLFVSLWLLRSVLAASRMDPPDGALVVPDDYDTIQDAVDALPDDGSDQIIFINPGTYNEQVYIDRDGPLIIYGYTEDTSSYSSNQVTISAGVTASEAGSNDASGTLRIHKDDFSMYNVNVKNTYGKGTQAIAISQYGSRVGLYGCSFTGYQDTLYANAGSQVYLQVTSSLFQGATDFIFGRTGLAYFGGNTIAVKGPGWVTASGRESDDDGSYVFDGNSIVLASDASSDTSGNVYLGRPWGAYAKVIFKNTQVTAPLNSALWSVWNDDDERTDHVLFADYNTQGSGADGADRPDFATVLSASEADEYSIASAVGSDYAEWVDADYL